MCKKREKSKINAEDRELIESNANMVNTLVVMADGNETVENMLKELQNELRYLIASDNQKVLKVDGVIQNQLQDLKIYLNKAKSIDESDVEQSIKEIKVSVSSRNNLI